MTGRLLWFATGVGVGVAMTRRLARVASGSTAITVASGLATRVRRTVDGVIADGRVDMHLREARLREVLAAPGRDTTGAVGGRR